MCKSQNSEIMLCCKPFIRMKEIHIQNLKGGTSMKALMWRFGFFKYEEVAMSSGV